MKPSNRSQVAPFLAMDALSAAESLRREGRDIVSLAVGQPGNPAPRRAREAVAAALLAGEPMGYTEALGLPALRERIARLYADRHGLSIAPERIVVSVGASGGFLLAFQLLFDAGDRVGIADPGYPSYRNILRALDLDVARLEAGAGTRYQPAPDMLEGLDGLLVASPANPTGSMLDRAALGALMAACRAKGVRLISDEIYHGLTHDQPAVSALEIADDVVVVNSFSKYWRMTGWRIGWMVVPQSMVRDVERLAQNNVICAPHISQIGALAALDADDELMEDVAVYARSRERLLDALPGMGITEFAPPDGAFYLYADIGRFTNDSGDFCARLLREAGVAATPGADFDPERGARFMRMSFAGPEAEVTEAIRRLRVWLPAPASVAGAAAGSG